MIINELEVNISKVADLFTAAFIELEIMDGWIHVSGLDEYFGVLIDKLTKSTKHVKSNL